MPVTSGSPTQIKTSVDTKAELSGTPADQFADGDSGWVGSEVAQPHGPFYAIQKAGGPPVNGTTVLAVFEQPTQRWVSWSLLVGAGGGGTDRFARRYIVGIGPTYPAAPQASPWRYVQDPGDGTGLQTVLAEAAVNPGDIWISPGTIDFNAGPLTGPLTVPANVTVYGAGRNVTTLIGLSAGFVNQGVLRLLSGAQVFDLSVQGGSANPSIGAAALVEMVGTGTGLARMTLTAQTSGDGAPVLRGCVQVTAASGGPPRFITLVDITATLNSPATATGNVAPLLIEGSDGGVVTAADRFGAFGGNYGARIISGSLIADKFIAFGPRLAGISGVAGSGAFRCDEAGIFHDPATAGVKWIGVDVPQGGGWILRSMSIQDVSNPSWTWVGVNMQDQAGALDIDGCIIQGAAVCISGPGLPGTGVSQVFIRNCLLVAQNAAIEILGSNTDACTIEGCSIDMRDDPLSGPSSNINVSGAHWTVQGNRMRNQSPPGSGKIAQCLAIRGPFAAITGNVILGNGILPRVSLAGPSCTFVGNSVETTDPTDNQPAVDVTADGSTLSGNVVLSSDQVTPIRVQASLTAISGNRIRTIPNTSGITLTALCNNSTAVGNVIESCAPAPAVLDLGVGNAVLANAST
jgi:hypothetical protein